MGIPHSTRSTHFRKLLLLTMLRMAQTIMACMYCLAAVVWLVGLFKQGKMDLGIENGLVHPINAYLEYEKPMARRKWM